MAGIAELGIPGMIKKISKHMEGIAEERDLLDETISELVQLQDNCSTAYDNLWHARDALSELV
jgi:hypothetical protein